MGDQVKDVMKVISKLVVVDDTNYENKVYEKVELIERDMSPEELTVSRICFANLMMKLGEAIQDASEYIDSIIEQGEYVIRLAQEGKIDLSEFKHIEPQTENIRNNKDLLVIDSVENKKVAIFNDSFKSMANDAIKQKFRELFGVALDGSADDVNAAPERKSLADYYNKFKSLYCERYGVELDSSINFTSTYTLTVDHSKPISDIKADIARFTEGVELAALTMDYYMVIDKLKADTTNATIDTKGRKLDTILFRKYDRYIRVYELIKAAGGINAIRNIKLDSIGKSMQTKYGEYTGKAYKDKPNQIRARLRKDYEEALALIEKAGNNTFYD